MLSWMRAAPTAKIRNPINTFTSVHKSRAFGYLVASSCIQSKACRSTHRLESIYRVKLNMLYASVPCKLLSDQQVSAVYIQSRYQSVQPRYDMQRTVLVPFALRNWIALGLQPSLSRSNVLTAACLVPLYFLLTSIAAYLLALHTYIDFRFCIAG